MDSGFSSSSSPSTDEVLFSRLRVVLGSLAQLTTELRQRLIQKGTASDAEKQKQLLEQIKKQ